MDDRKKRRVDSAVPLPESIPGLQSAADLLFDESRDSLGDYVPHQIVADDHIKHSHHELGGSRVAIHEDGNRGSRYAAMPPRVDQQRHQHQHEQQHRHEHQHEQQQYHDGAVDAQQYYEYQQPAHQQSHQQLEPQSQQYQPQRLNQHSQHHDQLQHQQQQQQQPPQHLQQQQPPQPQQQPLQQHEPLGGRRTIDTPSSHKQLLLSLNYAVSSSERQQALLNTQDVLSHSNTALHDHEVQIGVDKALCLKLGYIVSTDCDTGQVSLVCRCLRNLYRCSSQHRLKSFQGLGCTDIVPLFLHVWKRITEGSPSVAALWDGTRTVLLDILQVMRMYAKIDDESTKQKLIHLDPWIGQCVQLVFDYFKQVAMQFDDSTHRPQHDDAPPLIHELIGLLKDLSFRSRCEDKEHLLTTHGEALKQTLLLTLGGFDMGGKLAESLTAIVWNLALSDATATSLMRMSTKPSMIILEGLCRMLSREHDANLTLKTRRNAISALGNLITNDHVTTMVFDASSASSIGQHQIIPLLKRLAQEDPDSNVRRRAMRSLRCLATQACDDSDIHNACWIALSTNDIISFFVNSIRTDTSDDDDNDRDAQIQVCQALSCLIARLEDDALWPILETSLQKRVETTNDVKLIASACRCLQQCVSKSPWRRGPNSFSDMFWMRLKSSVQTSKDVHASVSDLLHELATHEAETQSPRSAAQPSDMANGHVADTLTTLISEFGNGTDTTRNKAVDTVACLIKKEPNKRPLAEHEGLLSALVNLCITQPDGEKKDVAKKAILTLVPEI